MMTLPKWFRLPNPVALAALRNSKFVATFLSGCQVAILAFLAVEIFKAFRDVQREFMEESSSLMQDLGGETSSGGGSAVLSPTAAQNLVTWLGSSPQERGAHPRSVPSWMVGLANDLKLFYYGVSDKELSRILGRLTKPQAQMLQTCMLRPSGRFEFDSLKGMDYAGGEIRNWLKHNGMTENERKTQVSSPYGRLLQQGRQGMAFWGPPGCGKSTMIKAVADELRLPVLVITPSLLQRKWYGESTNQVRTLFGLISSLGPCVVVLDELDGMFRQRNQEEHDASRELKTELLQWWDGVVSDQSLGNRVLIIGATNRPWDVDPAVWRRLPLRYYIGAPNWNERYQIWERWIEEYRIPADKSVAKFMADHTQGYTTSDIFQVLQTACQKGPVSRDHSVSGNLDLTAGDVRQALEVVPPTLFSNQYLMQLRNFLSPQDVQRTQQGMGGDAPPQDESQDDSHVWRTPAGNFYQFNVPVHPQVFDALNEMWLSHQEWESSSDDGDYPNEDDDSDTEYD
jgi:hypothetical protein